MAEQRHNGTDADGQRRAADAAGLPVNRDGLVWIVLYLLFVLLPLGLSLLGPVPISRGFWIEFGVGLGFVGLSLMGAQFALTARFPRIASSIGQDAMLQFHAQAGVAAFLFVIAHPVVLIAANPGYLSFFDPRVNLPRSGALSMATIALTLVVALPFVRRRIGMPYEWWRLTHGALAALVVLIGTAHIVMVGREGGYTSILWKQALWIAMGGLAVALLVRMRLYTPWRTAGRPYRVAEVRRETDDTWTLALRAEGHAGMAFKPGQFAWLTIGRSPWTLQQHPFSFSSSAEKPAEPEFTIKALGDFTSRVGDIPPGETALLEGPYGAFHPDNDPTDNLAFIVGGIGITPAMSMLRTFRDRDERRGLLLIDANRKPSGIVFREELERMRDDLDLTLVHVLEEPGEMSDCEQGVVTPELLDRRLPPAGDRTWTYFICGPEPMMNAVERALLDRGVHPARIRSERFNIA